MGDGPKATAQPRTAVEVGQPIRLGSRARKLLTDHLKPGPYLALLVQERLFADAIRFMGSALLNREAVWWSCLCVRHVAGESPTPENRDALGAAVRWVLDPSEANRQAALMAALAAGSRSPAGCVARAAYFGVGSPPTGPVAAPANPILTARLASAAVLLAAAQGKPGEVAANYRQYIAWGLDVSYGANRWE